jgi:DDE superfamily endonuclease
MDGERFVFIDETGATTAMTRRSGWGPKGERVVDAAPAGHWKTTTFVAGLRASGLAGERACGRAGSLGRSSWMGR